MDVRRKEEEENKNDSDFCLSGRVSKEDLTRNKCRKKNQEFHVRCFELREDGRSRKVSVGATNKSVGFPKEREESREGEKGGWLEPALKKPLFRG